MSNLFFLLYQIQSLGNGRIVLVPVLPDLEEHFNHVLTSLADSSFVQNRSESLKNGIVGFWTVFSEEKPDFTHESDGDFDGIVGRSVEAEEEDLQSNNLVCDILITQMSNKCRGGVAYNLNVSCADTRICLAYLVITLVGSSELTDESDKNEFTNLR